MKLFDVYPLYDISPKRADGVYVYDKNDQAYLDLYGGHGVISIGHSHPHYVKKLTEQLSNIGFYSNAIKNPIQKELAELLGRISGYPEYQLFMCNSGAEANENALKLASFSTGKSRIIAFENGFHGRTSAAVSVTDIKKIQAPINQFNPTEILPLNDLSKVEITLEKGDVCAVIIEGIQGVGGLDQGTQEFFQGLEVLCKKHGALLIVDEIQSGFGRSGQFFAHQFHNIQPDIITMAKGMANGFPVGGILISPKIKAVYGMLGTTFGGNHLACAATIAVLDVIEKEKLIEHVQNISTYFENASKSLRSLKAIKGRGLMLGLEFDFEVAELRKELIYNHQIFTGGAMNKRLLRILPPLNVQKEHIDVFIETLKKVLPK